MKKMMTVFVALVATLILSGCNNSPATTQQQQSAATTASYEAVQVSTTTAPAPSTTQSFTAEDVKEEPVKEIEEPAAPAIEVEWQSLTYKWEDEAGYKFEATIKVSPWINTENSDYLNSAWNEVAQGNTLPKADPKYWGLSRIGGNYNRVNDKYCEFEKIKNITDIYYCVGEINIANITEGWDIVNSMTSDPIWISACQPESKPEEVEKNSAYRHRYERSSTVSEIFHSNGSKMNPTWNEISPVYTSNTWKTQFVFAHFDNKTPANPEGENISEMQDTYFCINGKSYFIWEKDPSELSLIKLSIVE